MANPIYNCIHPQLIQVASIACKRLRKTNQYVERPAKHKAQNHCLLYIVAIIAYFIKV